MGPSPDIRLSTRNRFAGRVVEVHNDAVDSEVVVELDGGERLVSTITRGSTERLGLATGCRVVAVVKASTVLLSPGTEAPATSARNMLCGHIVRSVNGAVNGEVVLRLSSGLELAAVVTNASIDDLQLVEGRPACGVIKASNVLLAVTE